MGALLAIIVVVLGVALVASNSGDLGVKNARHALTLAESKQLYDAAYTGISEAIAERFQPRTNRYNLITSAVVPLQGLSGRLYSDPSSPASGNVVATYRYMVLGGQAENAANGTYSSARVTQTQILQPAFIISKADACFENFEAVAGAPTVSANGTITCSSGTKRSLTLVAKVDLSRSSGSRDQMTQLYVVQDDTNIGLDTTVFIPGTGDGTSLNFETAWQGGSGSTTGATLTHVVIDNNGTVTTYPVAGSSLDITSSGNLHETNTKIWFIFNDGIDFRTLYPGSGNLNECFTNSALQCGIRVERDETGGDNMNAEMFATFPAGNRVLIDADYPAYTNVDTSARNSWYEVSIPASTVRDWYGNFSPAFTLTFKSPNPVAACTVPTSQNISNTSGTVDTTRPFTSAYDFSGTPQPHTITAANTQYYDVTATQCNDVINVSGTSNYLEFDAGTGNDTISLANIYNTAGLDPGWVYFTGGTGTDSITLPGTAGNWSSAADAYGTKYSLTCGAASGGIFLNGIETVNFSGVSISGCAPPPPPPPTCPPPFSTTYGDENDLSQETSGEGEHFFYGGTIRHWFTLGQGANGTPSFPAPDSFWAIRDINPASCSYPWIMINTYGGNDTFYLEDSPGPTYVPYAVTISSGEGSDTFNITGHDYDDDSWLNGGGGNDVFNVGNCGNVGYAVGGFNINGGDGDDVINLSDTSLCVGVPNSIYFEIKGGAGYDVVNMDFSATQVYYKKMNNSYISFQVWGGPTNSPFRFQVEGDIEMVNFGSAVVNPSGLTPSSPWSGSPSTPWTQIYP